MAFTIEVENRFEMTRRDLQVRHKRLEETLAEQRVSCIPGESGDAVVENRWFNCSLGPVEGEQEYLEISVDNREAELGPCRIGIWSDVPFTFIPPGTAAVSVFLSKEGETDLSLKIPSGLPAWKLEIMRPTGPSSRADDSGTVNVTVSDDEPGGLG